MSEFSAPVDIANRALQHCGARRITAAQFASATDTNSAEVAFAYDKVRTRELRRNCWRYATRRAYLYPIDINTALFTPGVWSSTVTYLPGAIVEDSSGAFWTSQVNNNLNNAPALGGTVWQQYFGPLTIDPWQNPLSGVITNPQVITRNGYQSGDLVYVALPFPYDAGAIAIFKSLQIGNTDNPQVPDTWSATVIAPNGQTLSNPAPLAYYQNQVVLWKGVLYQSLLNGNAGNPPDTSPSWWTPVTAPAWVSGQTYTAGSFVTSVSIIYQALTDTSGTTAPASAPTVWMPMFQAFNGGTTYKLNQIVTSGGTLYQSLANSNTGNTPASSPSFWTTTITNHIFGSNNWLQLPGTTTLTPLVIDYPLNSGPCSQFTSPNIFRLPNGYLRMAPQDPKNGMVSFLGGPTGNTPNDWVFEGNYIISRDFFPILIRFVADISDVTQMDAQFCEGFAASLALEIAPRIDGAADRIDRITRAYDTVMGEARDINGIEVGSTIPPEDDYINCRI